MILNIIENFCKKIKGVNFNIDKSIGIRPLIGELTRRGISLIRANCITLLFQGRFKLIFFEKGVELRNIKHIRFNTGITLKRGVIIDGLSTRGVILGKNVSIGPYSIMRSTGSFSKIGEGVVIGDNTGFDAYCFIGSAGGVKIGSNVIFGQHVCLHAENHNFDDSHVLIKNQGVSRKGIVIDDDCWIGANVTILDGAHIGKGCVIGAGSLINGNIPECSVAVGVPARIVKSRRITMTNNEA